MNKPVTGAGTETLAKLAVLYGEANRLNAYLREAYAISSEYASAGDEVVAEKVKSVGISYELAANRLENDLTDVEAAIDVVRDVCIVPPKGITKRECEEVVLAIRARLGLTI